MDLRVGLDVWKGEKYLASTGIRFPDRAARRLDCKKTVLCNKPREIIANLYNGKYIQEMKRTCTGKEKNECRNFQRL